MEARERSILKLILSQEAAKGKTVYVDDTTAGIADAVFFMRSMPFSQYEDKEAAVNERFDAIVGSHLAKNTIYDKRFADEMVYEKEKYIELIGREFDFLKGKKVVLEDDLPDDDNSILVFAKGKPKGEYARSTVLRRCKMSDVRPPCDKIAHAKRRESVWVWASNKEGLSLGSVDSKPADLTEDLPYPALSQDYAPNPGDRLELCVLTKGQIARFRQIFTHRFSGAASGRGVGLLINGEIAGVIGYDTAYTDYFSAIGENELFLQYCIAVSVKDKNVKIGRLLSVLSLWDKCVGATLSDYDRTRFDTVVTASISPYPENKVMRRTMRLKSRKYDDKTGMYDLLYEAPITHQRDIMEIFEEWLGAMKRSNDNRRKQDAGSKRFGK